MHVEKQPTMWGEEMENTDNQTKITYDFMLILECIKSRLFKESNF